MTDKWKIDMVDITLLDEAELNANEMTDEEFNRLVENIRISGGLSSAIGCYRKTEDGRYVIFSGHHRKRAAEVLRMRKVPVVWADEKDLDADEAIALQLSHNSLHGTDNQNILKKMIEQIQSIDFKAFANININEIEKVDTSGVSFSIESEHYTMTMIMYNNDIKLLKEVLGIVDNETRKSDIVVLADGTENEAFYFQLIDQIRKKYDITSSGVAFVKLLNLAKKQMELEQ